MHLSYHGSLDCASRSAWRSMKQQACTCPHAIAHPQHHISHAGPQHQQGQHHQRPTARCRANVMIDGLAAVTTSNLQVSFGKGETARQVLKGVDLQIQRGSLHMLLGPNGCGKSTLLKVLGGLVAAAGGSVAQDEPTGFVFQNPDHQVVMPTVAADVAFGLGRYDLDEAQVHEAVTNALRLVNMGDALQRPTHTLSGGQRQRVAIAGALAENPRLLLLDELTTFLDVEDQFGVLAAVKAVTRRGSSQNNNNNNSNNHKAEQPQDVQGTTSTTAASSKASHGVTNGHLGLRQDEPVTAIWVTHRFEELQYADSASYMNDGRVVFSGTAADMVEYLKRLGAPGV